MIPLLFAITATCAPIQGDLNPQARAVACRYKNCVTELTAADVKIADLEVELRKDPFPWLGYLGAALVGFGLATGGASIKAPGWALPSVLSLTTGGVLIILEEFL